MLVPEWSPSAILITSKEQIPWDGKESETTQKNGKLYASDGNRAARKINELVFFLCTGELFNKKEQRAFPSWRGG